MNDFVKIEKILEVENPNFSKCEENGFFSSGDKCSLRRYSLSKAFESINITMNESTGKLSVSGCMGMYWNGHNLSFPFEQFESAISQISDCINVDLFSGSVREFDHSAVIPSDINPKVIVRNHIDLTGHLMKEEKYGKYFVRKGEQIVKLYDAGKRLRQIIPKAFRESILSTSGVSIEGHLIRFEKKILNPKSYFKKELTLNDLLQPQFIKECNLDLMNTYSKITKAGNIELPKTKKALNSAILPLIVGKELEELYGFNFGKLLMERIDSIDESIMSREDKKARKRQIRGNLNKLGGKAVSKYDLSEALAACL